VKVSIVVVAYRQRESLLTCLEACSVAAAAVAGDAELIVVDNGDLAGLVREHCPRARLLEPGANIGFAGAVRRGAEIAAGTWIALVNDDALIERAALAQMLAAGERSERIGAVAAQVRFSGARGRINSAGIEVDALGIATERLAGRFIAEAGAPAEVFGASACCALYRARMLTEIGGFDERFFAYQEDVDVAWRARASGWTAVYEPTAIAYHRGSASTGEGSRHKYFLVGRNRVWLLARNATRAQLAKALPLILLYDCAYVIYVALSDHTLAPLWGRLAGLRRWRALRRESCAWRRPVPLRHAREGWRGALRQHRAYRRAGG
jgi:GT2 family glycosyltransferase